MKTSTILIVAGVAVVGVYVLTRKSTPLPMSTAGVPSGGLFSQLGQILGGAIIGAGGALRSPAPGPVTSSSSTSYTSAGVGSSGDSEVAIVRSLDAGGISAYDAQGTTDAPVYGIAGVDY